MDLESFLREFKRDIDVVAKHLVQQFRDQLKAQGHVNTGKLSNSIRYEIDLIAATIVVSFFFEDYGVIVDQGVPASRIPYKPGSGATSSKYIDGLISFFKSKGLSEKEAKSASFATARTHKRTGMPTPGSSIFSSTGKRTGFVNTVLSDNSSKLLNLFQQGADNTLEVIFHDLIAKTQTQFQ